MTDSRSQPSTDTLPWKVFCQSGVLAIFSKSDRDIIHWSGFDAAQFDDATNRKHAALIVQAVNRFGKMCEALAEIRRQCDKNIAPSRSVQLERIAYLADAALKSEKPTL